MGALLRTVTALCLFSCVVALPVFRRVPRFGNASYFATLPKASAKRTTANTQTQRCVQRWRKATLDHYSWRQSGGFLTFDQKFYVCDEYWKNTEKEKGPIFIYIGNEAPVEKYDISPCQIYDSLDSYIEATGFMWESAPEFGAILVFIEHRFYGESIPEYRNSIGYLGTDQAIADYVEFVYEFQEELGGHNLPVIGFGGSLGGMYAAWMRMKYPHVLHGAIAASAPIWGFLGMDPPIDYAYFDKIKTYDAYKQGDPDGNCVSNIRRTWETIIELADDPDYGFKAIKSALGICQSTFLFSMNDAWNIIFWIDHAISIMAEGSFSFPSDYMTYGLAPLPIYPLKVGCSYLKDELYGYELLEGIGKMVAILYNVTQDKDCLPLSTSISEEDSTIDTTWEFQWCTEMFLPHSSDGVTDMFWNDPLNIDYDIEYCSVAHGVQTRPYWVAHNWGGKEMSTASNIVFSNGEYDPWRGGGVQQNISDTVVSVIIEEGGHHADLMFEHENDSESLKAAREFEKFYIRKWIEEVRARNKEKAEALSSSQPSVPLEAEASIPSISNKETALETEDNEKFSSVLKDISLLNLKRIDALSRGSIFNRRMINFH